MSIAQPEVRRGRPLILVADRNALIRKVIHTMLIGQGFRVLLAPTAQDTLKVATRLAGHLDLMVVEAAMSAAAGFDIIERISGISPRLPMLLMSSQLREEDQAPSPARDYISKPFTQGLLLEKVRSLITSAALPVTGLYKTASPGH